MKSRRFRVQHSLLIFLYTLLLCLVHLADADRLCCEQMRDCKLPPNCRCFFKEHLCRQRSRHKMSIGKRSTSSLTSASSSSASSPSSSGRVEDNVITYILSRLYWDSLDWDDMDYDGLGSSSLQFLYRTDLSSSSYDADNDEDSDAYQFFMNGLQNFTWFVGSEISWSGLQKSFILSTIWVWSLSWILDANNVIPPPPSLGEIRDSLTCRNVNQLSLRPMMEYKRAMMDQWSSGSGTSLMILIVTMCSLQQWLTLNPWTIWITIFYLSSVT